MQSEYANTVPPPQPDISALPNHGPRPGAQGFVPPQGAYRAPLPPYPPPPPSYPPVGHPNQSQSAHAPPYLGSGPQQWAPQGSLAPAPTASQVQASTYNPLAYGPMPGAYQAPVSPIGHSFQGVNVQQPGGERSIASRPWPQTHPQQTVQHTKPPLPPRSPRPLSFAGGSGYPTTGPDINSGQHPGSPRPSSFIHHGPAQFNPIPPQFQSNSGYPQHTSQGVGLSNVQLSQDAVSDHHQNQTHQASPANPSSQYQNPIQLPPRPPPLPLGYQVEIQKNQQASPQHPPYSYQPPTHRYDPPGQQAAQQQSGQIQAASPQTNHSQRRSYYPETPPPSAHHPPPPLPRKTPEDPYRNQYGQAQQDSYAPPQTSSSMPNMQPQTMSQSNPWTPSPQQSGPLSSVPSQFNYQTHHSNTSWDPAPAGGPQIQNQNVDSRPQREVHSPSASYTVDSSRTHSTDPNQVDLQSQKEAWAQFVSTTSDPERQDLQRVGYGPNARLPQDTLGRPILVDPLPDSNKSTGQVASRTPSAVQYGAQIQNDIYHPAFAHEYNQHHSASPVAGRPEETQFGQYGHAGPSAKPSSQVDASSQPYINQSAQQVPEKNMSPVNKPSHLIGLSAGDRRSEPSVSGMGPSLLGAAGGASVSDWEHFGEPPDEDVNDKPEIDDHQVHSSKPAAEGVVEHTTQSELPPGQTSFSPADHPVLPSDGLGFSIPAPLQLHRRDSDSNMTARSPASPTRGHYLPTPPPNGEPIVPSSGRTESIVSLEGFSPCEASSQQINRVINAWNQPVPGTSSEARHGAGIRSSPETNFVIKDEVSANNGSSPNRGATQPFAEPYSNSSIGQPPTQNKHRPSEPVSGSFVLDGGIVSPPLDQAEAAHINYTKNNSTGKGQGGPQVLAEPELGLDPGYKESLARYASMLRKESQATTKEEKLKVFTDFLVLECQQRGVPYGPISEAQLDTNKEVHSSDDKVTKQENIGGLFSPKTQDGSLAPNVLSVQTQLHPDSQIQDSDDEQYSPGGRPLLRPLYMKQEVEPKKTTQTDSHATKAIGSSARNVSESVVFPEPDSPGRNAPIVIESESTSLDRPKAERLDSSNSILSTDTGSQLSWYDPPQNTQQAIKNSSGVYKPYSPPSATTSKGFNEEPMSSEAHESTSTSTRRPSYTPYVSQARLEGGAPNSSMPKSSRRSTYHSGNWPDTSKGGAFTSPKTQQDETFLFEAEPAKGTKSSTNQEGSEVGAALKMILPRHRQLAGRQSEYVATIRTAMNTVPDDFTFLDRLYRDWETEANRVRVRLDEERQQRQEEQEAHTDRLFAENQIGYADIKPMEEEFKRSESARKIQEDEEEYRSYTQKVFDPIYTDLQEQIRVLMDQYMSCTNVLRTAVGGKGILDQHNTRPGLAQVVDLLLELYTRIEVRHGKVLNAVLDRDRRYKRTVLQPLYAAGDISEMKDSEKHFEEAEKRTTHEAAAKKEERVKALVHVIEDSSTRVLAEDLEYINLIAREVNSVSEHLSPSYNLGRPDEASDLQKDLAFARKVLQTLANIDLAIMHHSHTAALILNLAKYDVSNASAKLANAGSEELTKLRDQKLKDDNQLAQMLQQRVRAIEQDVRKGIEVIEGVLKRLSPVDQSGRKGSSIDAEHAERIRQSLEEAKRRNSMQGHHFSGHV